jgi:hypothetical protein
MSRLSETRINPQASESQQDGSAAEALSPAGQAKLLVIEPQHDGVVYRLPRTAPNISNIILMFLLLVAVIGLPALVHFRLAATTPKPVAIAIPILSLIISVYLVLTILMELFGVTQVIVRAGKVRVRQSLGFLRASFSCLLEDLRYLGLARSYAYKQSNNDPVDLFFIRKARWRQTAMAVYQNQHVMHRLLEDLKQRYPQYGQVILTQPPEDPVISVIDWLKIAEQTRLAREGKTQPPHAGIVVLRREHAVVIRARAISRRLPSFLTHPATLGLLFAALLALGLYHTGIDKTIELAKPVFALIGVAWVLGGLNRFFTEHDRVLVRISKKRVQVCRLSPFGRTRQAFLRSKLRGVKVGRAEMAGGYCLKVQYRGLSRQSPEFLENRPLEELGWIAGTIDRELASDEPAKKQGL